MNPNFLRAVSALSLAALVAACGGGGGGGGGATAPATYSVGGTVTGLNAGESIVLRNNGGDPVTVSNSGGFTGSFAFPTRTTGGAYAVTLDLANSGKNCLIDNASGSVSGANVTTVSVRCGSVFAYAANSGSATVSQYSIAATGQLSAIGTTTASVGDDPQHIAVHWSGKYAYVANGGGHNIRQYNIGTNGVLTPMSTATVSAGATSSITRIYLWGNAGGQYAYALDNANGQIYQFTIGANGALTPMAVPSVTPAGFHPTAMAINGNCNCAVFTDGVANGGLYIVDILADGSLQFKLGVGANINGSDIAMDAARGYFWVSSSADNSIQQWSITSSGTVGANGFVALNGARALALAPNGNVLWAANWTDDLVRPYQVVAATGVLSLVAADTMGGIAGPTAIATDGNRVYVANYNMSLISQYSVNNAATGALMPMASSSIASGTNPVAITLY